MGGEGVGEGEGGAGLTWLIVIVVNLPTLSLTCQGLRSPAGPVVVSLPARVVVNPLAPALVVSCHVDLPVLVIALLVLS